MIQQKKGIDPETASVTSTEAVGRRVGSKRVSLHQFDASDDEARHIQFPCSCVRFLGLMQANVDVSPTIDFEQQPQSVFFSSDFIASKICFVSFDSSEMFSSILWMRFNTSCFAAGASIGAVFK